MDIIIYIISRTKNSIKLYQNMFYDEKKQQKKKTKKKNKIKQEKQLASSIYK